MEDLFQKPHKRGYHSRFTPLSPWIRPRASTKHSGRAAHDILGILCPTPSGSQRALHSMLDPQSCKPARMISLTVIVHELMRLCQRISLFRRAWLTRSGNRWQFGRRGNVNWIGLGCQPRRSSFSQAAGALSKVRIEINSASKFH